MHEYLLVLPGFKLRRLSTERLSDLLKGVNDAIAESVILETQVQMVREYDYNYKILISFKCCRVRSRPNIYQSQLISTI